MIVNVNVNLFKCVSFAWVFFFICASLWVLLQLDNSSVTYMTRLSLTHSFWSNTVFLVFYYCNEPMIESWTLLLSSKWPLNEYFSFQAKHNLSSRRNTSCHCILLFRTHFWWNAGKCLRWSRCCMNDPLT